MAAKIGKEAYLLSKNRPGTPTVNKARLTKRILHPEMSVTNWQIGNMMPKRSVAVRIFRPATPTVGYTRLSNAQHQEKCQKQAAVAKP